jgi:hypothetical protein
MGIRIVKSITIFVSLALVAVFFYACAEEAGDYPFNPNTNDTIYSFSGDILPIFQSLCVSCHAGSTPEGDLTLTSYANLMAGGAHTVEVVPFFPDSSLLVLKIDGTYSHDGSPYDFNNVVLPIREWIARGALNN